MTYDALIIGGGLAGCSAAIQLARRGKRVLLLEKQRYPAHKLCGEFLSVEVLAMFERLGVREAVWQAGARPIDHTRITTTDGAVFESALPGTALGLSRYTLDRLLFEQARNAGAEAHDGMGVRAVEGTFEEGFAVTTTEGTFEVRLVLGVAASFCRWKCWRCLSGWGCARRSGRRVLGPSIIPASRRRT